MIESIEKRLQCRFDYTDKNGKRTRRTVSPAMLYTEKGRWYLIANDEAKNQVRVFAFANIDRFEVLPGEKSTLNEERIRHISKRASVWQSDDAEPFEVTLWVDTSVRRYLEEVPLHPTQTLVELHADSGDAVYAYRITHPMELLPEIKSWLPHIRILSPKSMQKTLQEDLRTYLSLTAPLS
jgi:predicted DNA-binding transcriptional regulator YafY